MAHDSNVPYAIGGNSVSEQAEASTANRGAGTVQMRILIELQVISGLLADGFGTTDELANRRQEAANSIT